MPFLPCEFGSSSLAWSPLRYSAGNGMFYRAMRTMTNIYGVVFLIVGFLGFIPWLKKAGLLLGLFYATPFNNILYILTALAAFWAASVSAHASRNFFRIFGAVYLALALIGFGMGKGYIFGVIAQHTADNVLHLVFAIVALFFGFAPRSVIPHGTVSSSP